MFRIITAFDSWHLNGVHCPSLRIEGYVVIVKD